MASLLFYEMNIINGVLELGGAIQSRGGTDDIFYNLSPISSANLTLDFHTQSWTFVDAGYGTSYGTSYTYFSNEITLSDEIRKVNGVSLRNIKVRFKNLQKNSMYGSGSGAFLYLLIKNSYGRCEIGLRLVNNKGTYSDNQVHVTYS